jgi:uncharacterized membrane protein YfcA
MENITVFALPLIGLIGGFLSGLLGLGGGVVMLPLLTFIGGVPLKLATGTSLVHVLVAAATGILSHLHAGLVDFKAGLILGTAGILGGFLGSFLSVPLSTVSLNLIFLSLVALAIVFLFIPLKPYEGKYIKGNFSKIEGILIGLGCGLLVGLLGLGGGFVLIPLMIYILRIPLRVTIGTSLMIILISSMGTFGAKYGVGHIDVAITFLVISGSVVGALLGAYVSRKTHTEFLRWILLSLLCLIFVYVGYKTLFSSFFSLLS